MLAFSPPLPSGLGKGNMPCRVWEGKTCPTGFGRGKHALVRLG